ncbi:hypothetical protein B0H11DRAFT_2105854 [Mycena galericulata]|nr:hypothetical protein B0H11DRAFT_2105854 [Mycena galericulata]
MAANYHDTLPSVPSRLLDMPMPVLKRATPDHIVVSSRAKSTLQQEAPMLFLPLGATGLLNILHSRTFEPILAQEVDAVMVEDSHVIHVEADVQRAISLYLLHGVNQILRRYLHVRCPGQTFSCECQYKSEGDSSSIVDIVWSVGNRCVLVMELKNWGAISHAEWLHAVADGDNIPDLNLAIANKREFAATTKANTAATGNAAIILKQVTKYASVYDVPIVLACDWGNMVYLDMQPGGQEWSNDDGVYPHFLFVDESQPRLTFRRVLLAAFLTALDKLNM